MKQQSWLTNVKFNKHLCFQTKKSTNWNVNYFPIAQRSLSKRMLIRHVHIDGLRRWSCPVTEEWENSRLKTSNIDKPRRGRYGSLQELFLVNVKDDTYKIYKNGISNKIFCFIGCCFLWKLKNLVFKIKLVFIEGLMEWNDCEVAPSQSYLRCFLQKC